MPAGFEADAVGGARPPFSGEKDTDCDLAIVGGGIAGSSLAASLAGAGARVVIVEREARFRDRVRGEAMLPWGAAEARQLDLHQALTEACAHEARWWTTPVDTRDLTATTPSGLGCLDFYHPEMQQALLDRAVAAGAELLRPAEVAGIIPGEPPAIVLRSDGAERRTAIWRSSAVASPVRASRHRSPEPVRGS